jgi:carbamoyltransferase
MSSVHTLSFRPSGIDLYHNHDPSAAIFTDGELIFAAEEERYTRQKHANDMFPEKAIQQCLDECNLEVTELNKILIPDDLHLRYRSLSHQLKESLFHTQSPLQSAYWLNRSFINQVRSRFKPLEPIKRRLNSILGSPLPPIEVRSHHACHAASTFHPSGFEEALVVTMDGRGEFDSTVIWTGDDSGVERVRTYKYPNSLGILFGTITEFLGFRSNNGEGKVMGLAPYGNPNPEVADTLREAVTVGVNYNVTEITTSSPDQSMGVENVERLFGRDRKDHPSEFTQWEKDLAYETQQLLEEIVTNLIAHYLDKTGQSNVALAGGVVLNCKLNKRIMEMGQVESLFIQPASSDAGLAVGAGYLNQDPADVEPLESIYYGDSFNTNKIRELLETNKIEYREPDNLERHIAERIADGELVGWYQSRMELGPRALGNRSILADPRTEASRDRINKYVKHREEWRPFAPSLRYEDIDEYLVSAEESPFMIKTFDVHEDKRSEIAAVIHPGDGTTRPQTVRTDQNPRYHSLLTEFNNVTDTPVLLNTSFNDHGEPIIRTPKEAVKAFYAMGLDLLVLNDVLVQK